MQNLEEDGEPECDPPDDCGDVPVLAEMAASFVPVACRMARKDVALEPVRNVSWLDARKYCKWRYGDLAGSEALVDLPTEAQWERAAAGPAIDGQPFSQPKLPTASTPSSSGCDGLVIGIDDNRCSDDAHNTENEAYNNATHPYTVMDEAGELYRSEAVSVEGINDMTGNVSEWVLDASSDGPRSPCSSAYHGANFAVTDDCFGYDEDGWCDGERVADLDHVSTEMWCNPVVGIADLDLESADFSFERVVKGGNFDTKSWCDAAPRTRVFEAEPDKHVGFRCVIWDQDPEMNFHNMCPEPIGADAPPTATGLPDAGAPDSAELDAGDEDI
jgi:formylglycine-generating enzyme required for sulfatase activity